MACQGNDAAWNQHQVLQGSEQPSMLDMPVLGLMLCPFVSRQTMCRPPPPPFFRDLCALFLYPEEASDAAAISRSLNNEASEVQFEHGASCMDDLTYCRSSQFVCGNCLEGRGGSGVL